VNQPRYDQERVSSTLSGLFSEALVSPVLEFQSPASFASAQSYQLHKSYWDPELLWSDHFAPVVEQFQTTLQLYAGNYENDD